MPKVMTKKKGQYWIDRCSEQIDRLQVAYEEATMLADALGPESGIIGEQAQYARLLTVTAKQQLLDVYEKLNYGMRRKYAPNGSKPRSNHANQGSKAVPTIDSGTF
jgi:hypothetical protein